MTSYTNRGFIAILAVIVVAVVALGGGVYIAAKRHGSNPTPASTATTTEIVATAASSSPTGAPASASATTSAATSLRTLLTKGGNYTCTFDQSVSGIKSSGTVYISGTKMRGDFTSVTAQGTFDSHAIKDGNTVYAWSDAMAGRGMKMTLDLSATAPKTSAPQGIDLDAQLAYGCSPSTSAASEFVPPATVNFMDVSAAMKGMVPGAK